MTWILDLRTPVSGSEKMLLKDDDMFRAEALNAKKQTATEHGNLVSEHEFTPLHFFLVFFWMKTLKRAKALRCAPHALPNCSVVCRASVLCNDSKAWPLHTTLPLLAVPSPHRKPVTVCYLFISVMRRERAVRCLLDCAWLLFISWMKTDTVQVLTVLALNSPCTLQLRLAGFSSFFLILLISA